MVDDRLEEMPRPLAVALSGGGAQGAAQAGALAVLVEAGLRPDLVVATSAGAWNAVWLGRRPTPAQAGGVVDAWLDPAIGGVFRGVVRGYLGAVLRRRISALSGRRLQALAAALCGEDTFADLAVPTAMSAVDLVTADLVYLDDGPLADAVCAASAIPSLLPPVRRGDRLLVDAGFVDNFGVLEALHRGARSVLLIDASVGSLTATPRHLPSVLDRANLVTRIHQRRTAVAACVAAGVPLGILEVAGAWSVLDFATAAAQAAHGADVARAWLCAGRSGGAELTGRGALHPVLAG